MSESVRGLSVQQLIHELTAEYVDPADRVVLHTPYYVDDATPRRCVVTDVRAVAGEVQIEFEPEEGASGE